MLTFVKNRLNEVKREQLGKTPEIGNDELNLNDKVGKQVRRALKQHLKHDVAEWINMNDQTELHATALHLASFNGNLELMNILIDNGADLEIPTATGVNALHMAAQGN